MQLSPQRIEQMNNLATRLKKMGIFLLSLDNEKLPGRRIIQHEGRDVINFTSSSYLGLETDERLKNAAIQSIEEFGLQFYVSRAYMSLHLYEELESLLELIFNKPVVILPSTTLAHLATIPVLVKSEDAIILDHQVHTSVEVASRLVKAEGAYLEKIRHNRVDYLENRVQKLSEEYDKIWYMADGVYSMFGDLAPLPEICQLLDKYPKLHLYIDDAHGMSWAGQNGCGTVLNRVPFHPKMVHVTSLGKGFGTSGGVVALPDKNSHTIVRNFGSPLIFAGPITPPLLGASIASAKIHLSDEIKLLQNNLQQRIAFFHKKSIELNLPFLSQGKSPIFYLGVSNQEACFTLSQRLKKAGFFTCLAIYPSVPYGNAGLRILPSLYHSFEDIERLLETIAEEFPHALNAHNLSMEQVYSAFGLLQS